MRKRSLSCFEEFMRAMRGPVYRFLLKLSKNTADAEDFTQDTFVRAFRSFDTQLHDRSQESWVMQIAFNAFLDHCREQKRCVITVSIDALQDRSALFDAVDPRSNPEEALLRDELSEPIADAIANLKPEQDRLIRLSAIEGMPYKTIASTIGSSLGTVKSKLCRTRASLKRSLNGTRNVRRGDSARVKTPLNRLNFGKNEPRERIKLL